MHPRRLSWLVLGLVVLLSLGGFAWWTISQLNSPLEVLNVLNPRHTEKVPTATEILSSLSAQSVEVPAAWKTETFSTQRFVELPEGFHISLFASGFKKARFMTLDAQGTLYLSDPADGKIFALPDQDHNGVADEAIVVAENLQYPHGLGFRGDELLVAETSAVKALRLDSSRRAETIVTLVSDLPVGGSHITRTLVIGPSDGQLYVSVGSSCNVCEDDPRRAAVLRYKSDGSTEELFAPGLRNAVGLTFHPTTKELWATDNGRDLLGDDTPPDEVNILRDSRHYGWPFCYGPKIADTKYGRTDFCSTTETPVLNLQAHSAPLGLKFYDGQQFPENFQNTLFIAYHGSWNRREPTGYKVVVSEQPESAEPNVQDFARGWLVQGKAWGRPVDLQVASDGALFLSDDEANVVYRIRYETPTTTDNNETPS